MVIIGGMLAALAFVIMFVAVLDHNEPFVGIMSRQLFNDLGSMLLTFVILWTYMSFSQFLLVYSGDLQRETPWYVHRLVGGWQYAALAMAALDFFLPFVLLISRDIKRNPRALTLIGALLVVSHLIAVYWLIMPSYYPDGFYLQWMDIVAPLAIGGLWVFLFLRNLKGHPLLPQHDRSFIEQAEAQVAHEALEESL